MNEIYRIGERVAGLERDNEKLWDNGQPGIISQMERQIEAIDRKFNRLVLVVVVAALASGSGTISLKSLLDLLSHFVK